MKVPQLTPLHQLREVNLCYTSDTYKNCILFAAGKYSTRIYETKLEYTQLATIQ